MGKYKLIACDLDDTLLNSEFKISEENIIALNKLKDKGVIFVPTTGRTVSEIPSAINNSDIKYIIHSNGATVWNKETQSKKYMCISKEVAKSVIDLIVKCDAYTVIHANGATYVKKADDEEMRRCNVCENVISLVKRYANMVEDFNGLMYSMDSIESFHIFFADIDEEKWCREEIGKNKDLYMVDAWEHNVEIFNPNAGKDKALKELIKDLGIDMEEVICIGDSGNDAAMVKCAGLGLGVSNGSDVLKNVADRIICSNDEHILEFVLREYFE